MVLGGVIELGWDGVGLAGGGGGVKRSTVLQAPSPPDWGMKPGSEDRLPVRRRAERASAGYSLLCRHQRQPWAVQIGQAWISDAIAADAEGGEEKATARIQPPGPPKRPAHPCRNCHTSASTRARVAGRHPPEEGQAEVLARGSEDQTSR